MEEMRDFNPERCPFTWTPEFDGMHYGQVRCTVRADHAGHKHAWSEYEQRMWTSQAKATVPEEWRIARFMRSIQPYAKDENIQRMIVRLARGTINDEKAVWLARAMHSVKPWAGKPVAFDDIGHFRPVGAKEADIAMARSILEQCKAIL